MDVLLTLKIDNVLLGVPDWGDNNGQLVMTEDTKIQPNCEIIVSTEINVAGGFGVTLVEPETKVPDITIAKCFVTGDHDIVSVRSNLGKSWGHLSI